MNTYTETITLEINFDDVWDFMLDSYKVDFNTPPDEILDEYANHEHQTLYGILDEYPRLRGRIVKAFSQYLIEKEDEALEREQAQVKEGYINEFLELMKQAEIDGVDIQEIIKEAGL